ncbi:DNase I-like protein [Polychaeton citri CBS 116435]|uniref:DNase I-like protein n=1 Tax=Polychaeton citri CBS 116435 TaxID=1314669 RepID=A0A9P4QIA1_9PEZI|nr:DNase I-like protein [Polychaeton citri CBS 116435]
MAAANSSTVSAVGESLSVYLATFNCGRKPVDVDFFSSYFFSALSPPRLQPDFIVLCLQEIAPLSYSFLGGSFLTTYFTHLSEAIRKAVRGLDHERGEPPSEYLNIATRNAGMIAIMVFAKQEVVDKVRWVESAEVGIGTWEMGNKGAVGVRMGVEGRGKRGEEEVVPLTFIAAHLQPMEGAWEERNADWRAINENMVFARDISHPTGFGDKVKVRRGSLETEPLLSQPEDTGILSTLFHPPSHLFFAGDLNYRTSDKPPQPQEWQRWPSDDEPSKKFQLMLRQDQLTREMEDGRTLHGLSEAPITFAPTYKYSISTPTTSKNTKKSRNPNLPASYRWAKHRVPSWCDRVLYPASHPPQVYNYSSLPIQPTSDHRPVILHCSIRLLSPSAASSSSKSSAITRIASPHTVRFEVRDDFVARRIAARRFEILVGIAAYLTMTTEGEVLVLGTAVGVVGGWILLKALFEFGL